MINLKHSTDKLCKDLRLSVSPGWGQVKQVREVWFGGLTVFNCSLIILIGTYAFEPAFYTCIISFHLFQFNSLLLDTLGIREGLNRKIWGFCPKFIDPLPTPLIGTKKI